MRCKRCDGKLKVTHTYSTPRGRCQRAECPDCLTTHTLLAVVVNVDPDRGEGAQALSKRLEAGEPVELTEVP